MCRLRNGGDVVSALMYYITVTALCLYSALELP